MVSRAPGALGLDSETWESHDNSPGGPVFAFGPLGFDLLPKIFPIERTIDTAQAILIGEAVARVHDVRQKTTNQAKIVPQLFFQEDFSFGAGEGGTPTIGKTDPPP